MKRIQRLILASIFIASTASAQVSKGSVLLGGNLSFSTVKSEEGGGVRTPNLNLNLFPSIGKAIRENLIAGFGLHYNRYRNGYKDNAMEKANRYGADVFLRKYYPLGKNFYLFGQGGLRYSYYKRTSYSYVSINPLTKQKDTNEDYNVGINAYPGISYAVSKKIQLEFGLNELIYINYTKYKHKTEQDNGQITNYDPSNEFSIGTNLSNSSCVNVGIRILLNNK